MAAAGRAGWTAGRTGCWRRRAWAGFTTPACSAASRCCPASTAYLAVRDGQLEHDAGARVERYIELLGPDYRLLGTFKAGTETAVPEGYYVQAARDWLLDVRQRPSGAAVPGSLAQRAVEGARKHAWAATSDGLYERAEGRRLVRRRPQDRGQQRGRDLRADQQHRDRPGRGAVARPEGRARQPDLVGDGREHARQPALLGRSSPSSTSTPTGRWRGRTRWACGSATSSPTLVEERR